MNAKFKDGLALLATALVASAFAWAFWHYLGLYAVPVMMVFLVIFLLQGVKPKFGKNKKQNTPN